MNTDKEPLLPLDIARWNLGFLGYVFKLVQKAKGDFSKKEIDDLQMWWDSRKLIEERTNCPEYWKFGKFCFIETIQGIDENLAKSFIERIKAPEEVPEDATPKDIPF